jgi:hypothetical protein
MDQEIKNKNSKRLKSYVKSEEIYYARKITEEEWPKPRYTKLCETCDIVYTDKNRWYQHQKTHAEYITKFICSWCNKHYARRDSLKRHSINVHGFNETKFENIKIDKPRTTPKPTESKYRILKKMPTFRIINNRGTPQLINKKQNKKTKNINKTQKINMDIETMNFQIPEPISPLNPSKNNSSETLCEDEFGQFSQTNEQIISIGSIYGIFRETK